MNIGITGATGFIGTRFGELARASGYEPVAFSRDPSKLASRGIRARSFHPDAPLDLSGLNAIVHLAGESIAGFWTGEKKRRIRSSRLDGTRRIVEALRHTTAPRILINASAIGYYGDTGEHAVDEDAPPGDDFLAGVCRDSESAALEAASLGIRVVLLRIGFVVGRRGGAMKLIAPFYRTGLGGKLGSGRQWMSCIHVDDVAGLILHAIETPSIAEPLNAVMPEPVRNVDFTRIAAAAARRPAWIPTPAFALRLVLGEFSHFLLASSRVLPTRTMASGYIYRFANLSSAMREVFAA